ncbi:MAG TPA: NTP transferase domain-containing protein [Streptosporangiaceae bacterium]
MADFGAVILAGGRATRLGGVDKPGLEVGGRTLLAAVVAAVQDAGAGRTVVVGPERPRMPVRFVREEPAGAGPFAALRRGLAELPPDGASRVAVLAADLPFLRAGHVRTLLEAARSRSGAVLVDADGCPQWLTGCWQTRSLRAAAAAYTGVSLRGLMRPLDPALVLIEPGPAEPPPWLDCDTGSDLRRARDWPVPRSAR